MDDLNNNCIFYKDTELKEVIYFNNSNKKVKYELSFNNFDLNYIRKKIVKLGGKNIHSFYPYNICYFFLSVQTTKKNGYLRVREEYNNNIIITTTILTSSFPEEYEIHTSGNFDKIIDTLLYTGLKKIMSSIKFKERWILEPNIEIKIDIWPGLPPVLELNCKSKEDLINIIEKLGLNLQDGYTDSKYFYLYGIKNIFNSLTNKLTFSNYKSLGPLIKKNKKIFDSINNDYYKEIIKNYDKYFI